MRSDQIEAALKNLENIKSKSSREHIDRYWGQGRGVPLGAQYLTQIAIYLIRRELRLTWSDIQEAVLAQHKDLAGVSEIAKRGRGLRNSSGPIATRRQYGLGTYREWLINSGKSAPRDEQDTQSVVKCVLKAADQLLASRMKSGARLFNTLYGFRGTAREALSQCFELFLSGSQAIDWTAFTKSRIFGDIPSGPPRGPANKGFAARYKEVVSALSDNKSVQVSGPHYCGKHRLLREVVFNFEKRGFEISNGSTIPLCALSLHEMSAAEAIEHIAKFYAGALGTGQIGETVDDFLLEIAHCSRGFAALFIVAGLETIDENEIVRALNQELLGEMIALIVNGHPDTRLLVSTSVSQDADEFVAPDGLREPLLGRQSVKFDYDVPLTDKSIAAANYEYRALRQAASSLGGIRGIPEEQVIASVGSHWKTDAELARPVAEETLNGLGEFVAQNLGAMELKSLAIVALSPDGLSGTDINEIIATGNRLKANSWPHDPVSMLDSLPDEIIRKPSRQRLGHGPAHYFVERAIRYHLLRYWQDDAPEEFRRTCWILARSAAGEARRLRARAGLDVSAGRDVQVLILLLASVAPDPSLDKSRGALVPEYRILPSLDEADAKMLSGREVVRFAYEILFDQDLARSVRSGMPVLNDAQLRLAAVRPFIDNNCPWISAGDLVRRENWKPVTSAFPWAALDITQKLRLLEFATVAATRLNLNRLVTHFARSAREITPVDKLTPQQFATFARIQRYELDLGIQLARNPDDSPLALNSIDTARTANLGRVEKRAKELLSAIPEKLLESSEGKEARLKLEARLVEILQLSGKHWQAYLRFEKIGRGSAEKGPRHFLAGRSQRMFTKLLVELARARLFENVDMPVKYIDGLVLPILHRSTLRPDTLVAAERLANQSLRELSIGRASDWIGVKIDQSRIASVQVFYADALRFLDEAAQFVRARGTTRDLVLELLSVQCRTFADAAAFAVSTGDLPDRVRRAEYSVEVDSLGDYLGLMPPSEGTEGWQHADQVGYLLCERATAALSTLKELVQAPEHIGSRYAIFAGYLEVWIAVVRSRQSVASEDEGERAKHVEALLKDAGSRLEGVLRTMVATGYLMHHREARLLVEGLRCYGIHVAVPAEFPAELRSPRQQTR